MSSGKPRFEGRKIPVKEVFDLQMGKTPSRDKPEFWNNGDYDWVSIKDLGSYDKYVGTTRETISELGVRESKIKPVPANTLIMSFKLSIGKTAITVAETFTNEAIMAFLDRGDYPICLNYMFHQFRSKDWIAGTNTAVMGKTLNKKTLGSSLICVPDIQTQQYVAGVMDFIERLSFLAKRRLSKLDELVKSRFVEMFGDPATNPNDYPMVPLSEIATYHGGLTYKPENVTDEGTIVLRSSNIQNGQLDFSDVVRVNCDIKDRFYVKQNDILMCSRNGSAKLVGKTAIIDRINEHMSFGAFMMIIRSDYYSYLNPYFAMSAFKAQVSTGTATINQITGKMLNNVLVPLPPMEMIDEFADFVQQVDKSGFAARQSIEKLQTLYDSLAQEYFG